MYSIESIVTTPSLVEEIRCQFELTGLEYFIPIFDESIAMTYKGNVIDVEVLEYLNICLDDIISDGFNEIDLMDYKECLIFFNKSPQRVLDRLINLNQPAIPSDYLALHAFRLCIKSLNLVLSEVNSLKEVNQYFGEASETIALARLSSAYLELNQDFSDLVDEKTILLHKERRKSGRAGGLSNAEKYKKNLMLIDELILSFIKERGAPKSKVKFSEQIKDHLDEKWEHAPSLKTITELVSKHYFEGHKSIDLLRNELEFDVISNFLNKHIP